MASPTRSSSNPRASLAVVCGLFAVAAVPAAVVLSNQTQGIGLLDAAYAIPFAVAGGVAALLFVRGARAQIARTLDRAGGRTRIRAARLLAILGLCVAASATIAVVFYEVLLKLEG